jgi:hypothetical protein
LLRADSSAWSRANSCEDVMSAMPKLNDPSAVILKFVAVEALCMISDSARSVCEASSARADSAFSASFTARLRRTTSRLEYLRDSPGASGIVATRSPA